MIIFFFLKSTEKYKASQSHKQNKAFAAKFYTSLSTQTLLTAGQLRCSYTNLCTRDPSQASSVMFGSYPCEQEEFQMAYLAQEKNPVEASQ